MRGLALPVETGDGHRAELQARIPDGASASLLWLPGMGLAARHFLPFAEAMAARGIATFVHEWRGFELRAGLLGAVPGREMALAITVGEVHQQAEIGGGVQPGQQRRRQ